MFFMIFMRYFSDSPIVFLYWYFDPRELLYYIPISVHFTVADLNEEGKFPFIVYRFYREMFPENAFVPYRYAPIAQHLKDLVMAPYYSAIYLKETCYWENGVLILDNSTTLLVAVLCVYLFIVNPVLVFNDAPFPWQIGFQDPATAVMEAIINFHNDLFLFLVSIVVFVSWVLARCIILFNKEVHPTPDNFVHGTTIEIVWTLTPALILIIIAIPSFSLLYSMDEVIDPQLTVKAIGHQWYWSYEYSDFETESGEDIAYDSYMYPDKEVVKGGFRLLETQLNMMLPVKTHVRLITTSADVIHSFAVPSFGVKLDACPGRLNQTSIYVKRLGRFYGQCSEICGVNHGFMPIAVSVLTPEDFMKAMSIKAERMGTELV